MDSYNDLDKLDIIELLSQIFNNHSNEYRRSGRSTLLLLAAIKNSLRSPDILILYVDHLPFDERNRVGMINNCRKIIPNEYQHLFDFNIKRGNKIYLCFNSYKLDKNITINELWISIIKNSELFSQKVVEQV